MSESPPSSQERYEPIEALEEAGPRGGAREVKDQAERNRGTEGRIAKVLHSCGRWGGVRRTRGDRWTQRLGLVNHVSVLYTRSSLKGGSALGYSLEVPTASLRWRGSHHPVVGPGRWFRRAQKYR